MYGIVSYKKQIVLGLLLLIIVLGSIELFANVWAYNFYKCSFESNEIFKDTDEKILRQLCIENLERNYSQMAIRGNIATQVRGGGIDTNIVYFNSEGYRGPEFTKEKDPNTYRIFLLGGSTTFNVGVLDNETWAYYFQQLFDKNNPNLKVEVINLGYPYATSFEETKEIKSRFIDYNPDLIIVYDGINDLYHELIRNNSNLSPTLWSERWIEICDMGYDRGYDTLITLQPLITIGKKILTEDELRMVAKDRELTLMIEPYSLYIEKLADLKSHCTMTADLRGIFDYIQEPIYFDGFHTGPRGNQIIAENFYELTLPIITSKSNKTGSDSNPVLFDVKSETQFSIDNSSENDQLFIILKDILSSYKTPKIIPLIFQN